jgi:hypothetical protein
MAFAFVTAFDSSFAVYKHMLGSLHKIYRYGGKSINKTAINEWEE